MVLREQLPRAVQINFSPQFIQVFVKGAGQHPFAVNLKHSAPINQIPAAGLSRSP